MKERFPGEIAGVSINRIPCCRLRLVYRNLGYLQTEISAGSLPTLLRRELPPTSANDDNPVFDEHSAARFVGVTADCLKKWRQRKQGPDYIQFGQNGVVRYELNALCLGNCQGVLGGCQTARRETFIQGPAQYGYRSTWWPTWQTT